LAATFKAVAGLSWCQWTPASVSMSSLWQWLRGVVFAVIGSLRHDPLFKLEVVDSWLSCDFKGVAFVFVYYNSASAFFNGLFDTVNNRLRVRVDSEEHLPAVSVLDLIAGVLPDLVIGRS